MPPPNNRRNAPNRQQRVPLFARTHPFLYKLFLFSSQFTTPLTLLTIASTSTYLPEKLSVSSLLGISELAPWLAARGKRWPVHSGWSGKTISAWLWYFSVWSYIARYALVGTSVVWVVNGWEDEGDVVERENGGGNGGEVRI